MSLLLSITNLLSRHREAIKQLAAQESNNLFLKVSLQLNRLRKADEQRDLLYSYYHDTLETLKELDESGAASLPMLSESLEKGEASPDELNALSEQYLGFAGATEKLSSIDFTAIENAPLSAIPKEHEIYPILFNYREYLAQEYFLERIKELLDLLEGEEHKEEKLSAGEVKEVKDEKVISLTAAQKVLAMAYLMRWAGIELGERQGARHHRFIAALTGISTGTVKEKYPSASVEGRPNHIQNLRAIIPLFESLGSQKLAQKLQAEIELEQERREE